MAGRTTHAPASNTGTTATSLGSEYGGPGDGSVGATGKKSKGKKMPDASEVGKALAAKINQLELDAAGEKDQEMEIGTHLLGEDDLIICSKKDRQKTLQPQKGVRMDDDSPEEREVKKATRDLSNLLNQMDTPMSKLEALQKKYSELLSDMKRMDRENTKNKKRADLYQKEKDQNRSQLTKTDAVKAKLETLCRELQRENKKLKDEQKRIESDERTSREELSDRADTLFWELNESMSRAENPQESAQSLEADEIFRQKFKSFIEQYELRELHVLSMMKTKDSEVQLHIARAEEYRKRADKETSRSQALNTQVATFSGTETELRSQLNIYVEKFKQVEDTLNNSNDLFLTFRKEMEEMSKKTKRLEKENLNLTRKHDLTNRNILEMAEERTKVNRELEILRKKNSTLESVIRRMQDQGRAPVGALDSLEGDDEGTESEYDDDEYDDEGSEEGEFDDDTEDEALHQRALHQTLPPGHAYGHGELAPPATYGPPPPPPAADAAARVNGASHRALNGDSRGAKPPVVF